MMDENRQTFEGRAPAQGWLLVIFHSCEILEDLFFFLLSLATQGKCGCFVAEAVLQCMCIRVCVHLNLFAFLRVCV